MIAPMQGHRSSRGFQAEALPPYSFAQPRTTCQIEFVNTAYSLFVLEIVAHLQRSNEVLRCMPPALSIIPLSLVAAPKNDTGDPGIPDCRQLEHPVIVIDVC